jgi:hypothetical protein
MQGMMIQDISTRTSSSGTVVARGGKATAEKPFDAVLNDQGLSGGELSEDQPASVRAFGIKPEASEKPENAEAVPFFMAALFDHSAAFVNSSENVELVAGAEQAQKLIDAWLNAADDQGVSPAELLTKALDALGLTPKPGQKQAAAVAEVSAGALPKADIAELKELMRVMLDRGQLPRLPEGRSLPTELAQVLAQFQAVAEEIPAGETKSPHGRLPAVEGRLPPGDLRLHPAKEDLGRGQATKMDLGEGQATKIDLGEGQAMKMDLGEGPAAKRESGLRATAVVEDFTPQPRPAGEADERGAEKVGPEGAARPAAGLQESQMARLLKPREEQPTLHQQQFAKTAGKIEAPRQAAADSTDSTAVAVKLEPQTLPGAEQLSEAVKNLTSLGAASPSLQAPGSHPLTPALVQDSALSAPAARMMQLASGLQLAENQLVGQVVSHLAGSSDGESGRIRLRLHPAELGSVRLDLIVEGDRVRAHLQAQTQQVQEVLGRHLPQLREALQQQGLIVDEFRVDVQTSQDQSAARDFAWQQSQQREPSARTPVAEADWPQPEIIIPLQQVMQTAGGSISLRV